MFPKFYSYWRCTLTCVRTHQLYNKYHNCERTKQACLCYTHTYTQCRIWGMWWKTFFVSSAPGPWVPPRQGNVLFLGLQAPPSSRFKVPGFIDGFAFCPRAHWSYGCHLFPQSRSSHTHLHFFLPKRQTWMDGINSLPGPSALCWVDQWGALGSLREGGQGKVAVSLIPFLGVI